MTQRTVSASGTHPEETLIGLQDLGTRFRIGQSGVYNQVFGGDGMGVAWSQANDNVSLCTTQESYYFRTIDNPPDDYSKFLDADNADIVDYFYNFFTPSEWQSHCSAAKFDGSSRGVKYVIALSRPGSNKQFESRRVSDD